MGNQHMTALSAHAQSRPALLSVLLASTMLTSVSAAKADAIETVVVTAEKRVENVQKVAMNIQVLGNEKLAQLHVESFSDYVQYLPSVSFSANAAGGGLNGPGSANVYMRGVASGGDGNHSASQPSVGMYLDEQPITTIGGSLDIHAYDIARVESLAGPQGTLYGASSEAGTIRIITNKPDPSGFSASYDVEANTTDTGGVGDIVEGYANIPLTDNAAIRLVAWQEHDGGYIDNVNGTNAGAGIVDGVRTFPTSGAQLHAVDLGKNFNTTDIFGGRAALKIDLNDNWSVTPSFMIQQTKTDGDFAFDPAVGDLKVVKFRPEFSRDRWYQAALTIQGKIGDFDLTYAGAYMDRHIHSQLDYSDYSYFYDSSYGHYFTDNSGPPNYVDPSQYIIGLDHFTKDSHELRLASPSDWRFRFVAGLFYQRQFHQIIQNYQVPALGSDFTIPGWPHSLYLADEDRVDQDEAAFAEVSYDILPSLTVTAGGRLFESDNSLYGFFGFSGAWQTLTGDSAGMNVCFVPPLPTVHNAPCTDLNGKTVGRGFTHKLNATWHITDDDMVYFTWSNGFRPGGVNRVILKGGKIPPYSPDYLNNYELGWKTAWLDDSLYFNGDLYLEDWKNFQFTFLGPQSIPIIANAGEAQILGIEANTIWKANDNLTIDAAAAYTDAELAQNYCKDPACLGGVLAPKGQELPITPRFKTNATARYDFIVDEFKAHVQGSLVYNGSAWDDLRTVERAIIGKTPAYTVFNFNAGIGRDNWTLELSVENLFDERAQLYRYSECTPGVCGAQTYIIPNRPRTIGLKFGQSF
jgi:outer membrane receptor protein involved in Fe transport